MTLWQRALWLKDPEDPHQNQLQDRQSHPQNHQNQFQNHPNKQLPLGAPYMYGSGSDSGGPGGGSGGPGAGSDVGPQGPSATWGFATPPFSRPDRSLLRSFKRSSSLGPPRGSCQPCQPSKALSSSLPTLPTLQGAPLNLANLSRSSFSTRASVKGP